VLHLIPSTWLARCGSERTLQDSNVLTSCDTIFERSRPTFVGEGKIYIHPGLLEVPAVDVLRQRSSNINPTWRSPEKNASQPQVLKSSSKIRPARALGT